MVRIPTHAPPAHPGETLREDYLPDLGLTQQQLAARLGISFRRVNEIVNEKRPITLDTAMRLGRLFGQSPQFWLNLQLGWDVYHARSPAAAEIEQIEPMEISAAGG
jgi:addiction module HigA family antidote